MTGLRDLAGELANTLPVFPCKRDKTPLVKGGFKAAVRGFDAARALFDIPDARLIGVPTGAVSGLVVVDVDKRGDKDGFLWYEKNESRIPKTRTHKTTRGIHLLFQMPDGIDVRNSASEIAEGVDVRGNGGYVIFPPSPGYEVLRDVPVAELPAWLLAECLQKKREQKAELPPEQPRRTDTVGGSVYGLKALEKECEAVRRASFGTQERTLNNAAFNLAQLIGGGELDRGHVVRELRKAAASMPDESGREPWTWDAIDKKIAHGIADGGLHPRMAPELHRKQTANGHTHSFGASGEASDAEDEVHERQDKQTDLPLQWYDEIEESLDTNDFVEGILMDGSAAVLYGESNSGKTFLACDMALHVAAGKPWMGREVETGSVIYCALEGSRGLSNRVAAWRREHNLHGLPFGVIQLSINLLDPLADTPRLISTALSVKEDLPDYPLRLIVIDTLARSMIGGSENEAEDMGALIANMDAIRRSTGACVLFVHHTGKDPSRGSRGHSSLRAAVDTEIEVQHEPEAPIRMAKVVKQRELATDAEVAFSLRVVTLGINSRGRDVTTCIVVQENAGEKVQSRTLSGRQKLAIDILNDLLARAGEPNKGDVPASIPSVPADWWRERFFDRALAGADADTKRKAFRRVADDLQQAGLIGLSSGRVWLVPRTDRRSKMSGNGTSR
jgi:hypothetical protein